jgi:hypothetical protein
VNVPLEGGILERYSEVTFVIFDLKNLILTYTKDFPKRIYEFIFSDLEKKKSRLPDFCNTLLQVVKNTERMLQFFLLSYIVYSYIQLILLMDEFPLHHKIQRKENIVCQGLDVVALHNSIPECFNTCFREHICFQYGTLNF